MERRGCQGLMLVGCVFLAHLLVPATPAAAQSVDLGEVATAEWSRSGATTLHLTIESSVEQDMDLLSAVSLTSEAAWAVPGAPTLLLNLTTETTAAGTLCVASAIGLETPLAATVTLVTESGVEHRRHERQSLGFMSAGLLFSPGEGTEIEGGLTLEGDRSGLGLSIGATLKISGPWDA